LRVNLLQERGWGGRFLTLSLISLLLPACIEPSGEGQIQAPGKSRSAKPLPKVRVARDGRTFVAGRKPFVPIGVNYYRPGTGWAPQVWKQFDPELTRQDFARMKELGVTCVRVFLTYKSFYPDAGELLPEGLAKFDRFLELAEEAGIYVHPTGPDHWEGMPNWGPVAIEEEQTVAALESFWRLFAARYQGRTGIFAYDLKNEPELGWESPTLRRKWNEWLKAKYSSTQALFYAWNKQAPLPAGEIPIPAPTDAFKSPELLDYQSFREEVADEWTRRQVNAIKAADPDALVTVGLIQWSVPALLPGLRHYSAFLPSRQAEFLDFMEIHFYPLVRGAYEYQSEADELGNLAYLESVVREVALTGKPVVLAEFGWYGGGKPKFDGGIHPAASEEQHANYCRRVVETTAGLAVGWLNWGFYDQPEAKDCSELTGLLTADGRTKAWGREFQQLAAKYRSRRIPPAKLGPRPQLDWAACLTSAASAKQFRDVYLRAFSAEHR
jgi:hypothetical protein